MSSNESEDMKRQALPGQIRFIGEEHGRLWLIQDADDGMSPQEREEIVRINRGAGIEIYVYDDEGELIKSG